MDYINSIMSAVIIFPLLALIITVPFILYNYHKYGAVYYFRSFVIYSFILYLMIIYFLVIFPLPRFDEINMHAERYQLIPFKFVFDFIVDSPFIIDDYSTYWPTIKSSYFYVPIFNILMFVPLGMYLRYYFRCSLKKTFIISFLISLFFEITQLTGLYFIYPYSYRLFDVDDLILNTLGGILGFYLFNLFKNILPIREEIEINTNKRRIKVSIIKRMTLFFLDLFIFSILYIGLSFILSLNIIIVAVLYYIFIPIFTKGRTLGSQFLHITLTSKDGKLKIYQIIIRGSLFLVFLLSLTYNLAIWIMINMINCIYYLITKEFIHETLSNTKLKSTFVLHGTDND